jgi:mannonate dehydratase
MKPNRRTFLQSIASATLTGAASSKMAVAQQVAAKASRGLPSPKIRDVSVIETQPAGARLTVVKITTDQDGLYGYGCATFTQRADLVKPAVERYLKPLLLGKTTDRIEDLWQTCYDSSYWKNGPVLNNAISGIDEALWDIKGRQTGVPVYQLVGGKCREAAECFATIGGDAKAILERAKQMHEQQGFNKFRIGGGGGGGGRGSAGGRGGGRGAATPPPEPAARPVSSPRVLHDRPVLDREAYYRNTLKLFEDVSRDLPAGLKLATDVHSKLSAHNAVQFCKECEKFPIFFIEDPLAPEELAWFRQIRQQCTTPIAMGELFNSPHEWEPLIQERLIDYIRCHVSQVGGFTPARKIAILGEQYGVQTAWHAPGDLSPVGHMANVTLDVVSYNFGIQEWGPFNQNVLEVFSGCAEMRDGYLWVSEKPGWGIEVDEKVAAKFPFNDAGGRGGRTGLNGGWGDVRLPDGTVVKQ